MPTYDYQCRKCGHTFEVFESISATPRRPCPKCAKGTAHRMIGAGAGLLFKGSGFYLTDYKGAGKPEAPPKAECGEGKGAADCACAPAKKKNGAKK